MTELAGFLETYVNTQMIRIIISGPRKKEGPSKIQIRPLSLKGEIKFQETQTVGQKELHKNYEQNEIIQRMLEWMEHSFKQLQLEGQDIDATVLISKKGKATIKIKKSRTPKEFVPMLAHNRKKKYLLEEGRPVPFLIDLGVMSEDGKIKNSRYDKFRQLNRFLEFIEDILPKLPKEREVTILDFGCGKSYLTFILYHYFTNIRKIPVHMTGLDLKEDVIEKCNLAAKKYGYENLHFELGDICGYQSNEQVDMVITLHACDTATDHALYHAVRWNTEMIFSVPCCQHELNSQIQSEDYSILTRYGLIKERTAALMTDAIRANLLEAGGYKTDILEFVDFAHTPKNLLIRAKKKPVSKDQKEKRIREVERLMQEYHLQPTFYQLLKEASYI